ncbi:MAG TPA: 7-cyano-7-deazaguanine synthase [Vicinamibacterales bacterium]|nr:7-cyano-7-deazaguanine synthase [Vicinamibacterales bacterium]HOQ59518.1 7-cyano-7-deazaguanine synthase [Vicinamibacterales bacterium]HPK70805.1 7-cyano-7-deazaguanine synthase [Vicinamibacterales bacterium]HPW19295.1 7-cyano-7-deazaguanine synthase [Vicinamibacterales bacterium]
MTGCPETAAVLCSAGLDSVVLAAHEATARDVQPVYVSSGLAWEPAELARLERLGRSWAGAGRIRPPVVLDLTMRDVYPASHWAIRGAPPAYDTPDEDVYLAGRNIVLLSKAAVYCAGARIHRLAIGLLAGNPFPDATPAFFGAMSGALSLGLAHRIDVVAPFASLRKADVIRLGAALGAPLDLSLSCMSPQDGLHCGACSKCRERRDAFDEAGLADPARYAAPSPRRTQAVPPGRRP